MRYVVGVDCGGSKSVALAVDDQGQLLGRSRSAGANPMVDSGAALTSRLRDLLAPLQLEQSPPEALCLGISGGGRSKERQAVEQAVRALAIPTRVQIVHDAEIALRAGCAGGVGIALIAGTGSMSYGRDRAGSVARCGGWGHLLSDEGSATWLVREALRHILQAHDGRGPSTQLTVCLAEALAVDVPHGLLRWVYEDTQRRDRFAVLLPAFDRALAMGDAVALQILETGARFLVDLVGATARQLKLDPEDRVVLAGGAFLGCAALAERVVDLLAQDGDQRRVERLDVEPAWGAVRLALLSCGLAGDVSIARVEGEARDA